MNREILDQIDIMICDQLDRKSKTHNEMLSVISTLESLLGIRSDLTKIKNNLEYTYSIFYADHIALRTLLDTGAIDTPEEIKNRSTRIHIPYAQAIIDYENLTTKLYRLI